jgi:hypothetical protein
MYWDQGFHLHPDERMLIIVATRLHFWDNLNPHFFSYGSLPIYLLKAVSQGMDALVHSHFDSYDGMLTVGRWLSVIFDTITIFFVYKIARLLSPKSGPFAAFLYAIAFFPIQNSHFFVVDVFLTSFITISLYVLLLYLAKPRLNTVILLSFVFACALTTKITALIFAPLILLAIFVPHIHSLKIAIKHCLFFVLCTLFWTVIFMPYAWLDYTAMMTDLSEQTKMRSNAYLFPYTLQYVGSVPYWYFLKNIFLWGIGPITSLLTIVGLISFVKAILDVGVATTIKGFFILKRDEKTLGIILFTTMLIFSFFYFVVIGNSAVKFMRYMLPLYPFFAIIAGIGIINIKLRGVKAQNILVSITIALCVLWTTAFLDIYSTPHTRIQANDWILDTIAPQSHILVEHWDDRLPLSNSDQYTIEEMTLYDQPDDNFKWLTLNRKLVSADYLIIASNRLYVPLQHLTDCNRYRICYPLTADYYKKLLNNQALQTEFGPVQFKKVKEFTAYPQLHIFNFTLQIPDDAADESFTVYDHPKIMIFKRVKS